MTLLWQKENKKKYSLDDFIDDITDTINKEKGDCKYIIVEQISGTRKGNRMSFEELDIHWFSSRSVYSINEVEANTDNGNITFKYQDGTESYIYRYDNEPIDNLKANEHDTYTYKLSDGLKSWRNMTIDAGPLIVT